jgi:hypothetical protein
MRLPCGLTAVLLIGTSAASHAGAAGARVWAGTIDLMTWEEGPPDPSPHLPVLGATKPWYPYTIRMNFGAQKRIEQWRALYLENEYLECIVLPDLGGRLYRCRDKLSGYEMFHANPSIKKANIAPRGAWAAAGVELNFPVSHSLTTVSPVDFRLGPSSVWVGALDRTTGMRWCVEFRLDSGSAVLIQTVRFENATGAPQKYSWWTNAGVTLREDTRFVLPVRQVATHGKTRIENWPTGRDGIDRSDPAKYPSSLGLFAYGAAEGWFAVRHEKSKLATVHVADALDVPGKKIWAWGRDEDREVRERLSDDGSQYVEMQAGLFENQETFGELAAGQARTFRERWLPVRGLSGITHATSDAVLYAGEGTVEILATRPLSGAKLRIAGTTQTVTLDPAKVWARKVADAARVELRDAAGKLLLAYPPEPSAAGQAEPAHQRGAVKEAALARWAGNRAAAAAAIARAAALDPTDPIARFEQVRQGVADPGLWTHLAADPERVLDVADAYLGWGLDRDAAIVLGYRYPPVPANQREPGAVMPQDHALVVYYRGYVHQRLDRYAAEDFRLASTLPLTYVFPYRASSPAVLRAALAANPADAGAHRLLGLWLLYTGNRAEGERELAAGTPAPASKAPAPTPKAPATRSAAPPAPPETEAQPAALSGARAEYFAALAEWQRGDSKAASRRWESVAKMRAEIDSRDYVYPLLALAALGRPFDAVSPFLNLRRVLESASGERRAVLEYNESLLLALQGKMTAGNPDLPRLRLPR